MTSDNAKEGAFNRSALISSKTFPSVKSNQGEPSLVASNGAMQTQQTLGSRVYRTQQTVKASSETLNLRVVDLIPTLGAN